jgi:4-hydroxybenzoate polyprenyltransferase
MKVKSILNLIRVHQWIKNLFLFLPMFFGIKMNNLELVFKTSILFCGFSLIASSIYVLNDYLDIESDQKHPKKKNRPLASGAISTIEAIVIMFAVFVAGILLIFSASDNILIYILIGIYVLQNILYSIKLKHIPIIDITILSIGFVVRISIGGLATNTPLSHWIVIMTFMLAMFLALAKRSDDLRIMNDTNVSVRKSIVGYNLEFLNSLMTMLAGVIIITYIMYATSPDILRSFGSKTYLTTVFVILGIMRYLQISLVFNDSGSPTKILLKDTYLQVILSLWVFSFIFLIYF